MRYREFDGKRASVIALGSKDFGGLIEKARAFDFLDAFFAMGGTTVDTARVYGDFTAPLQGQAEDVVGRWMETRKNRAKIVLSTKGAHPALDDMKTSRLSRADILYDIQKSLDALRTDNVDIYFLHRDDPARPVADIMETLNLLVQKGFTKRVGVSNWKAARIKEAMDYAKSHGLQSIQANQAQFSLARQVAIEDETLCQMDAQTYAFHEKTALDLFAFSPLAKGFFSKLASGGEALLSEKAKRRYMAPENMEIFARVKALCKQTGASVTAVSLAYLTAQDFPTYPIVGTSNMEQVLSLKEAGDTALTREEVRFLRAF